MWNESGGGVGHELNPNTFYEILKEYKSYIIKKRKADSILYHIKKAMPSWDCKEELPLSALLVLFDHHGFYLSEV